MKADGLQSYCKERHESSLQAGNHPHSRTHTQVNFANDMPGAGHTSLGMPARERMRTKCAWSTAGAWAPPFVPITLDSC